MLLAVVQTSAGAAYKIAVQTVDAGGLKGSSASYSLIGKTRSQGLALNASASFIVGEGFLRSAYFGAAAVLAPLVTAVSPAAATNDGTVSMTITGANFSAGAAVKLSLTGEADVTASNVALANSGSITCDFNLSGIKAGLWSITVVNPDGRSGALPSAFTVKNQAPVITSIAPAKGTNAETVSITDLAGKYFRSGAAVKLSKTGESDITAENVSVDSANKITCRFGLTGKNIGAWDVVVANSDGLSATLSQGFKIESPVLEITKPVASEKNPFNPSTGGTTFKYTLSKDAEIRIYVFNIRGELVWEYRAPSGTSGGTVGENQVVWDGITAFKSYVSSGVYLVHVVSISGGQTKTLSKTKMAVIK